MVLKTLYFTSTLCLCEFRYKRYIRRMIHCTGRRYMFLSVFAAPPEEAGGPAVGL